MTIFEMTLLVFTFFVVVSIAWSTLHVGISPMPSTKAARNAVIRLSEKTGDGPVFELGSGWGNLLIPLARAYPKREIVGYELSILPWFVSLILIKLMGLKNANVHRKNFLKADLRDASVVICYLYPAGMVALENKIKMINGNLLYLVSHNFALPSYVATEIIKINDFYKSPVYLYEFSSEQGSKVSLS